ncbi:MAG: 4-hydroxythreonine-4-phosphate dehydrogenase PdxA [Nitrospira sp.]|nr:4-hydroxythreonine-4-phosphate dehydrogenase PdxA [Nitrospira sp.]
MKRNVRKPVLALTMGDPAGIGPEVIAKACAMPAVRRLCRPVVVGSLPVMEHTVRSLRLPLKVVRVTGHGESIERLRTLPVFDPLEKALGQFQMSAVSKQTGAASALFVEKAVRLTMLGCFDGIVTAPINKKAINLAGYDYPGHTELLADLTKAKESGMMILGGPLRIIFVTTHVAHRELAATLSTEKIAKAIRLMHKVLRESFGIARPRIGVAALNPHAGEQGLFGNEEARVIAPACRQARARGIRASDPLPADTLFGKAVRGSYDGVVAMYHDQGLIPLKLLAFGTCVNMTVGLPIIRTSVDHGTAFDIAGKGKADPGSMVEAITLAARLAARKRRVQ